MTTRIQNDWASVEAGVKMLRSRIRKFQKSVDADLVGTDADADHWQYATNAVEDIEKFIDELEMFNQ